MLQQAETLQPESVSSKLKHSRRYGKLPLELIQDPKVSDSAKVLYALLAAQVFQGRIAKVGQRLMAANLGVSVATVCRRLAELKSHGYIGLGPTRCGQRAFWILNSPVFGSKQGSLDEVAPGPSGRRLVSVRTA